MNRRNIFQIIYLKSACLLQEMAERSATRPYELLENLSQVNGLLGVLLHWEFFHYLVQMQDGSGFKVLYERKEKIVNL